MRRVLVLGAAVQWGVLMLGCSAGSAALLPSDCRSGDTSMTCCIKKFPADPVGAWGATASDIEQALRMASHIDADVDDYTNNASLPEWKQWCIKFYVRCVNYGWNGKCDDCLRYCEGQQDWRLTSVSQASRGGRPVPEKIDWNPIRALAQRVLTQGEALELTEETRALLRKSALEVALPGHGRTGGHQDGVVLS